MERVKKCIMLFRICVEPPPLQSQAQEVQWGLAGHDDGGAAGGGGAEQQYHQVIPGLPVTLQSGSDWSNLENWNVFLSERRAPPPHSMGRTPRTGN